MSEGGAFAKLAEFGFVGTLPALGFGFGFMAEGIVMWV